MTKPIITAEYVRIMKIASRPISKYYPRISLRRLQKIAKTFRLLPRLSSQAETRNQSLPNNLLGKIEFMSCETGCRIDCNLLNRIIHAVSWGQTNGSKKAVAV
jgi:hypothetical protein